MKMQYQYAPAEAETSAPKIELTTQNYLYKETRELIQLVTEATELVSMKGEAVFEDFRLPGSRWRQGETYIFVLDPEGNMLVHFDPEMEGKNQLDLKDVNGKPIVRGLLEAATTFSDKERGWYHYEWEVPGGIFSRWKSSYVQLVKAPSGKKYIVGSGMYNDRMERVFVIDMVKDAVSQIEMNKENAYALFHDPEGPFMVKDAYIFVIDMDGVEIVNPAFPNLEGRNIMELKDTNGKQPIKELFEVVRDKGSGWVDYMWPKPGESTSTQKSAYVCKANLGDKWVIAGCGVYLADAPKAMSSIKKMTAPELVSFVREGAALLEKQGEKAFADFRKKGSRWFRDDTYFFVFDMDGKRIFHAAEPESEGRNDTWLRDIVGRPIVKMILEAGTTPLGEGWAHYMYPQPEAIFPAWKSSFVKRVTFPDGKQYIAGCGIYNMQMDKAFIEDVVNRAAALIAEKGEKAFQLLRDKTGPFVFMDTYVFVQDTDGVELVNPAQPGLEGRNLIDLKDSKGKAVIREEITAAITKGSTWIELNWYQPGNNRIALKQTYVRKTQSDGIVYVVGSGLYPEEN